MNIRTALPAVAAVAALAVLPACSSGDSSGDASATTTATTSTEAGGAGDTTTTASAATGAVAAPEPAELEGILARFFDPNVPAADKRALVDDDDNAGLLDQFNGVLAGYPLTATVQSVQPEDDDTVTATTEVAGPHGGAPMPIRFDHEDGAWRISDDSACQIFSLGRLTCA